MRHSEREQKRLREKNELLQLELQSRPHIDDYNKSKQKIRQLEKLLQEHSVGYVFVELQGCMTQFNSLVL